MADSLLSRLQRGWNAFNRDPTDRDRYDIGPSSSDRPDRRRLNFGTEKSIAAPLYNQIAIDVSAVAVRHVRIDQNGSFLETIDSGLNNCLSLDANVDQTGRAFIQDVVMSMFDEGCVAIVPVDTTDDPRYVGSYDIKTMRTGKITQWYPYSVNVNLYNDRKGIKEDLILSKRNVAIIENPLYAIMNGQNSTLKRLIHKLNLLDSVDEQSGSGKLDLIIQVPYTIKSEARKIEAAKRRKDIENQLKDSKYGIAYIDATEKATQLNRPAENNLMTQVEYLTSMLHSQLGLTQSIFDGTADEKTMLNYYNRTIEPIISAITDGMTRTFLTKTARTQGQAIAHFRNPFGLVPTSQLGTIADVFVRNAILSKNELRGVIGYQPSSDPEADKLSNPNVNPTPSTKPNIVPNTEQPVNS